MIDIKEIFGQRVRYYRKKAGISQEQLAERCDLHPTYIGQLERGEKNASLETIMRVSAGLGIAPETLFEKIVAEGAETFPQKIYNLVIALPAEKQQAVYEIISRIADIV